MTRTVTQIANEVRSGAASASDIVRHALDRADAAQGTLNAFTLIDRDGALEQAAAVDQRLAAGDDPGPLAGVPIGLKDLIDQEGRPNTLGSAFPPRVPSRSAPVVTRLETAGAVIIGRTGLHEFAFGFSSENEHFGPVRNPWDARLSPGGSSGGSAAAVAAGVVPAAIGTDTGGSVRVPAAVCGVVGLKVTHGRVPLTGVYPLASSLDTIGPITRSVADAAAVYQAVAGDDPRDPWSVPRPVEVMGAGRAPDRLRAAVPLEWTEPATAGVAEAFARFVASSRRRGAVVESVAVPALEVTEAVTLASSVEIAPVHRDRFTAHPDRYGTDVARRLAAALAVSADTLVAAYEWRAGALAALSRLFTQFDVVATPTVGARRKVIGEDVIDLDGEPVSYRKLLSSFTAPINRIGVPALALPLPATGTPPASVQLVGPAWAEASLLEIGLGLEESGLVGCEEPPLWYGK